jgi:ketosteroid isomerase-like protein
MPPNAQDRVGKSEVYKAEEGAFSKYKFDFEMIPTEVRQLSDTWGIVLCTSQGKMIPIGGGGGIDFRYRVVFLMEKELDGRWLIARQIWNQKPGESTTKTNGPW